jgi:hypothetical protein
MAETIIAKRPLSDLFLAIIRRFDNAAQCQQLNGVEAPYDPTLPVKRWLDLSALSSPRNSVVYDNVLALDEKTRQPLLDPTTKRPYLDLLVLAKKQAASVNIPPDVANFSGVDAPEVQIPCRALADYEYVDFGDSPFEGVVIRDRRADDLRPATYTLRDQQALQAIAAKLGVAV